MPEPSRPTASDDAGPTRREIDLGDAGRLTIRPVETGDVAGLDELFESLDLEDRHRRFFSAYRPTPAHLRRMTETAARGGVELVCALDDHQDHPHLVAEAGYELLPDGDGELGITVTTAWRGWLGPFLLDHLLSVAAAREVPGLEADVLVSNGPMLALARRRGAVDLAQPDWTFVRLLIGTRPGPPSWPPDDARPHVLVEASGGGWNNRRDRGQDDATVVVCAGPLHRPGGCPALQGQPCPLAAGADAIVLPDTEQEPWPAMADAHEHLHPGVPVCLVASPRAGSAATPDEPAGSAGPARVDDHQVVVLAQRHHLAARTAGDPAP